jgi:hypothetical protein
MRRHRRICGLLLIAGLGASWGFLRGLKLDEASSRNILKIFREARRMPGRLLT